MARASEDQARAGSRCLRLRRRRAHPADTDGQDRPLQAARRSSARPTASAIWRGGPARLAGERDGVDARSTSLRSAVWPGRCRRHEPLVDGHFDEFAAPDGQCGGRRWPPGSKSCKATRPIRCLAPIRNSTTSSIVSDGACQATWNPARRRAESALAPRATTRPWPRARRSGSPRSQESAASSHMVMPMPVVATRKSGGRSMSSRVACRSASSRERSTVRIVGPWMTSAPRFSNRSACARQRRRR